MFRPKLDIPNLKGKNVMWFNVFQALLAGGMLYIYSYYVAEPPCYDPSNPCGYHDIVLPPSQLQTCHFSDVGCP